MGTRKFSIDSLKRDKKSTLVYTVSLGISFMLMFTVFNLAYTNIGDNDEVLVIAILIFSILAITFYLGNYINDFFMNRKAKEISVSIVSGASLGETTAYFLTQNLLLSLISIFIGFIGFLILKPILGLILNFYLDNAIFTFSKEGSLIAIILIFMEIFFITLSNVGISYRNEIYKLIEGKFGVKEKKRANIFNQIIALLSPITMLAPIVAYLFIGDITSSSVSMVGSILLFIGFSGAATFSAAFVPLIIEKKISTIKNKKINVIKLRNLKDSLDCSKGVIVCYLAIFISFSIMSSAGVLRREIIFRAAIIVIMSAILLMITFIYKFYIEGAQRKNYFLYMKYMGYEIEEIKEIIKSEVIGYFLLVFTIPIIQLLIVLFQYTKFNLIDSTIFIMLIMSLCIIVILAGVISYLVYRNTVMKLFENNEK